MKLIVGLGNPGLAYRNTRHNIGYMFLDRAGKDLGLDFRLERKFKSKTAYGKTEGEDVLFLKPATYMNQSGEAVRAAAGFYRIEAKDILVIMDDMDLPVGKIRIRSKGSAGGQKGMGSIIKHFGTEIPRIRIGIGHGDDAIKYVLSRFGKEDRKKINLVLDKAGEMTKDYLAMSFENFMNKYNAHD